MDYLKEIKYLNSEIEEKKDILEKLVQDWINAEHPLKIDDVVEVNDCSCRGKKMIVRHRSALLYSSRWNPEWIASGDILKKNGEPGLHRGEWSQEIEEAK